MEMREFLKAALKNVNRKLHEGTLDRNEEGYSDAEEMLLDWIWIELKEESPDKEAVIALELDDLFELIEGSADIHDDYKILLESLRGGV